MLTKQKIDKFYKDVEALNLKFPVATIAKALNVGKGQTSQYLRRKQEPSENFINAFYENFSIVNKNQDDNLGIDTYKDKYIALLEDQIKTLKAQIKLLTKE